MKRTSKILLSLAFSALVGCVSEKQDPKPAPQPSPTTAPIEEINLLAVPVALNFDQKPGPDGFVIKVYASNRKAPKPVLIENGKIEVFMFDAGVNAPQENTVATARKIWTFQAHDLKPFQIQSSIGIGYQLAPRWDEAKPSGDKISVVVRYTPPDGHVKTSAPSIIAVAAH